MHVCMCVGYVCMHASLSICLSVCLSHSDIIIPWKWMRKCAAVVSSADAAAVDGPTGITRISTEFVCERCTCLHLTSPLTKVTVCFMPVTSLIVAYTCSFKWSHYASCQHVLYEISMAYFVAKVWLG